MMKVVIIAGGKGTRMATVATDIPKSMIPLAGKPVVEYQIELARRYGYTDILFITGHLGDQIEDYFGNGSDWGVSISYYREWEPLGTAGALRLVKDVLTDEFWVFYGDTVMDFDMKAMLDCHHSSSSDATLFVHPNDHPFDSDLVDVTSDGIVSGLIPKPHDGLNGYRNLVNAALYILNKNCIDLIPQGKADFGKDLFPCMLKNGKRMAAYISHEYIKDMGTPERWKAVGDDILSGKVTRLNRSNPRPCFFLDRDGVINREVGLLSSEEQMELIPGAAEAVKKINESGFFAVVVTNQPQIARNICTFAELEKIHKRLEALLGAEGAYLDAIYFCPHHPDSGYPEERVEYKIECECRKPKPGMLLKAAEEMNIDLSASYMIGDSERDIKAGNAAEVRQSVLIPTNMDNALLNAVNDLLG